MIYTLATVVIVESVQRSTHLPTRLVVSERHLDSRKVLGNEAQWHEGDLDLSRNVELDEHVFSPHTRPARYMMIPAKPMTVKSSLIMNESYHVGGTFFTRCFLWTAMISNGLWFIQVSECNAHTVVVL